MATFVLLYSGGRMPEGEEETRQVMGAWETWMGKYHDAITDPGNPFSPTAKTIRPDGTVADGPVGTPLGGYSLLKTESLDKAVTIAKEFPVLLGGGSISVYETFDVMAAVGAEHQH
jgi:hypothetical protein